MKKDDIKKMMKSTKKEEPIISENLLSTGSTLLNLACSGNANGGFLKGGYFFIVGDSSSGKTFLSLTCLAEASINKNFKDYRFIYDNSEGGALMNMEVFFGKAMADRLEPPNTNDDGSPLYSSSIEEFYYHIDDAFKEEKPFIYILDSMDSLTSKQESDKFDEDKKAYRKGKVTAGSYGDGKAKKNSANLRKLLTPLRKTKSILIIINQTRDNIGYGFEKKTRSGGNALTFYACLELWSSIKEKIKKEILGKPRQLGVNVKIRIKKNRMTGKDRVILLPIYYSTGFDEIGSCVDYLLQENHWSKKKGSIEAKEFDFVGTKDKLIAHIEEKNLEKDLQSIVEDTWNEIEAACKVNRKSRY